MNENEPVALWKKVIFSSIVFVTLLSLPEVVCRVLGLGVKQQEVAHYIANWQKQWDSDFYLLQKGPDNPDVNKDGLRDKDHSIEKPPNTTRVMCVGDSVTFGYQVPASDSYPAVLRRLLREKKANVEVFNLALPGWSARQQQIAYERIGRKYKPDYVILGICLNDIPEIQNNLTRPPPVTAFLFDHSYFFRWVMRPQAREIHQVEELFERADEAHIQNGWTLFLNEVLVLKKMVEADGAQFAVLLFPFRFQVLPDPLPPIPQRLVGEFAEKNNIPYFDGLPALKPLGGDGFIDYDHLSLKGATAVAKLILDSRLLIETKKD